MSAFTSFDHFTHLPWTRKLYVLERTLRWHVGKKDGDWLLTIEAGTTFDISVPFWLEWALSPHDRDVLLAALIHDVLLRRGYDVAFASAEFRRALIARKRSRLWSWILFTATLIWTGLKSWLKNR